jgi:hypothetical protein
VPAGYPYSIAPVVQTSVTAFQAPGVEAFGEAAYWTSTQYSESIAWYQNFTYGYQYNNDENYEGHARAVRLIQIDA